jgi:SAM-dependent methyltransferase
LKRRATFNVTRATRPAQRGTQALALATAAALALGAVAASRPAWWPAFVALSGAASLGLVLVWRRSGEPARALPMTWVLAGAVALRLAYLPLPPVLSDDAFRYVWDGMLLADGLNPYLRVPSDPALAPYHDLSIYARLNSPDYFSVYPPVSQAVFLAGAWVAEATGGGWQASYYAIKALFAGVEMAGVVALARMVSARAAMLYAWHPLVLVEAAGQGHTDAALAGALVAACWALRRNRGAAAALAWAAAVLTKIVPVVLYPFLQSKMSWKQGALGTGACVLAALPFFRPEVPGNVLASLDLYVRLFEFNAGPYLAAKEALRLATGADWSKALGPAFRWAFLAALPILFALAQRERWTFRRSALAVLGTYLALGTTVHPWYLLAVLPLATGGWRREGGSASEPVWAWWWLATASLGTYLVYLGAPWSGAAYAAAVALGWGGWAVLLAWPFGARLRRAAAGLLRDALDALHRRRAAKKAARLRPHLADLAPDDDAPRPLRVLDLGAGEGFVGARLAADLGAEVTLADVIDLNRTALPHVRYDGRTLPFADDAFDAVVLYFVLHHAECPERVLAEALRVSAGRVLVMESVVTGPVQRRVLGVLDRLANRLRSGGAMAAQEEHLAFRSAAAWRAVAERLGARVVAERRYGRWPHPQALLVVRQDA